MNPISRSSSLPKMLKPSSLFCRKKPPASSSSSSSSTARPFAEFYDDWSATLATALLPRLRSASPALLSARVDEVHHHFLVYYEALDRAAAADVAQCLCPDWRNSLEQPFLWLGDLHPYLFTNLLRSLIEEGDLETAWKSPSKALTSRADQIECGLRLMVPALAARAREAQARMVRVVAANWRHGRKAVEEGVAAEMEELVGVVVDANRMRRSVVADVLSVTSVQQAASYLESLAQFLVGFRDVCLLTDFYRCHKLIN